MNLNAGNRTITLFREGGYYLLDKRHIGIIKYTMYLRELKYNISTKFILT